MPPPERCLCLCFFPLPRPRHYLPSVMVFSQPSLPESMSLSCLQSIFFIYFHIFIVSSREREGFSRYVYRHARSPAHAFSPAMSLQPQRPMLITYIYSIFSMEGEGVLFRYERQSAAVAVSLLPIFQIQSYFYSFFFFILFVGNKTPALLLSQPQCLHVRHCLPCSFSFSFSEDRHIVGQISFSKEMPPPSLLPSCLPKASSCSFGNISIEFECLHKDRAFGSFSAFSSLFPTF